MAVTQQQALEQIYSQVKGDPKRLAAFTEIARRQGTDISFLTQEQAQDPQLSGYERMSQQEQASRIPTPSAETTSKIARPIAEGLGGAGGAILGSGAGPLGTVAGGALGYAGGGEIADVIDQFLGITKAKPIIEELGETGKRVLVGSTMEAGGQAAMPIISAMAKPVVSAVKAMPALTKAGAAKKAGRILVANTSNGPIIADSIEQAERLEEIIPDLRFTRAQKTAGAAEIKLERAQARGVGEFAQQTSEQTAKNTKAIRDYIATQQKGGTLDDIIQSASGKREALGVDTSKASALLQDELSKIAPTTGVGEGGDIIRGAARSGKTAARAEASQLFEQVPTFDIDASSIITKIDDLSKPMNKFEAPGNVPEIFDQAKTVLTESGGKVTPQDLQSLRSSLTDTLRDITTSSAPNNRMTSRISQLISEVDSVLEKPFQYLKDKPGIHKGAETLKTAQQFFKQEVIEKFSQGPIGDILKKGAAGDKVGNSQIASRFFKPGPGGSQPAKEFMSAIGTDKTALSAMQDAISQDLISTATNPITGELTEGGLKRWLFRNKSALKEFKLENKFNSLKKASEQVNVARSIQTEFEKSAAAKLLNADPESAIRSAFAGTTKKKATRELLKAVKGDKTAIKGLQNSIVDHVIDSAETTAMDAFNNKIISVAKLDKVLKDFKPVLDIAFKDSKNKVTALNNVQKAVRTLQKTSKSPLGGGSDTAENVITYMSKLGGMGSSRVLNIAKTVIAPFKKMSENEINSVLNRALLDPDFAMTLSLASKGMPVDAITRRLKGHLLALGMRDAASKLEQPEETQ